MFPLPRWPWLWTTSTRRGGAPLVPSLFSPPPRWTAVYHDDDMDVHGDDDYTWSENFVAFQVQMEACVYWPTAQVYVGGAPRTGNHGVRPGTPPRLYQLVRIGIVGVLFSHFHWQEHLFRHHTFQIHEIEICQQSLTTGTSSSKLCWLPAQGELLMIWRSWTLSKEFDHSLRM